MSSTPAAHSTSLVVGRYRECAVALKLVLKVKGNSALALNSSLTSVQSL